MFFRYTTNAAATVQINAFCLDNSENFENSERENEPSLGYEPYTTENLNQIDFKLLSEPVELEEFFLRFDDRSMLEKFCKRDETSLVRKRVQIKSAGRLDAYILWFDLNLDEQISITNSPRQNKCQAEVSECWQHAIYNIRSDRRIEVSAGQLFYANVKMRNDCFLVFPEINQTTREAASCKRMINLELNRVEVALLNNSAYQDFYIDWFEKNVLAKFSLKSKNSSCTVKIGLLTGAFSLFMLRLLFEYTTILEAHNCKLTVELFVSNQPESEASSFRNFLDEFKAIKNLRVNYLNDKYVLAQSSQAVIYDLDYLFYEPIDARYAILRKNLLSDLLFIRNRSISKGTRNRKLLTFLA